MKQLLRTIDGWQFEAPLALLLAVAAGFAGLAMPHDTLGHVPVAGGMGGAGRALLALLAALLFGMIGYAVMRRAGRPRAATVSAEEVLEAEPEPEPISPERLRRLRRADAHPDAPPRVPIHASRDLGEPFMDFADPETEAPAERQPPIPDADYVELLKNAESAPLNEWDLPEIVPETAGTVIAGPEDVPFEDAPKTAPAFAGPAEGEVPEPVVPPAMRAAGRVTRASLGEMMDRLSSGLERRAHGANGPGHATIPDRDMRPALRDALDELNRIASRRG